MAEIDPPQPTLLPMAVMQSRRGFAEWAAQEQIQPVIDVMT